MKKNKIKIMICMVTASVTVLTGLTQLKAYSEKQPAEQSAQIQSDNYIYGIGSVSKMFCTAAVMKLVDDGKIDLDTPIINYIPEFCMADERYKEITPKMLLNHSSGLMGTTSHNGFVYGGSDNSYHDNFLVQLKSQELKAAPGEYSVYCNDGFMLAEILVERVSGMSFSDYINKEISIPLGLENTFAPDEGIREELLAPVYYGNYTLPYVNCQLIGSGGLYGTTDDLCRFSQIFMKDNSNILKKESVDLMSKSWYLNNKICADKGDSQIGYGLGWDSVNAYPYNLYNIKALTKSGDVNGYHTGLTVLPEQNLSAAITTSGGSSTYCQEAIQDIILEVLQEEGIIDDIKDIKIQAENKAEKAPLPEEMKEYAGFYISANMINIDFRSDGTLLLKPLDSSNDTVQEYAYTKSGEFVSTNGYYMDGHGALVSNANGNKGLTKLKFRKEANGKTYIMGTSYESTMGLGEFAYTLPLAEKTDANNVSSNVLNSWSKRAGKKYYLTNEVYNSNAFLYSPIMGVRLSPEVPGYVSGYVKNSAEKGSKIINENEAKCEIDLPGLIGRDLPDLLFSYKNNTEYLSSGSYTYIGEEALKSSEELPEKYTVSFDNSADWYKISEKDAGSTVTIKISNNAAYYIYDKDENCISSSLFKENSNDIILPKDGYIVLAGEKGAVFNIIKE
ncbi:MAG TPA: serine hydrolase domain-containing protein [Oscillospiraceae bacterium]|nr:serine hydrolase domain-containing protein [Oscillospiraceae bacterium]